MEHSNSLVTPLGALGRGLLAGAGGTAAMTAWQMLSAKLPLSQRSADAQSAPPEDPWGQASAPAQLVRRVGEGVFKQDVSADTARPRPPSPSQNV